MSDLYPDKTIQKILISTTSRLVGEYRSEGILITHAWPNLGDATTDHTLSENPLCRNSFVVSFRVKEEASDENLILRNYAPLGDNICCYLSILYGKRFDNHGLLEGVGLFHVPQFQLYSSFCRPKIPQNNHSPRKDLEIPLNLGEIARLDRLLADESLDLEFVRRLQSAGQYYLQALQMFEGRPDVAYLNLVTAGEILSNAFQYDNDDLLDAEIKSALAQIEGLPDGSKISKQIRGRLLQVKRRFVRTICRLTNDYFFTHSDCAEAYAALKRESFEEKVAAAYDLRSRYVHTGVSFGQWVSMRQNWEIQVGKPVVADKELGKSLAEAPTYYGLERIIRFCLLRFMHLNGVDIDPRLAD